MSFVRGLYRPVYRRLYMSVRQDVKLAINGWYFRGAHVACSVIEGN